MTESQLLAKRNEELAKQDGLIQDLLIKIAKLEIELSSKNNIITELRNKLITLNLEKL